MKNKFISAALVFVIVILSIMPLAGCGNEDYPVEVANFVIEKQPEKVVVLDAPTADIISYMGYINIEGRSDDVNQEWLDVVPSMGSAQNPDIQKIKSSGADIVFASEDLSAESKAELEKDNILVITMSHAMTAKQLETNYTTLGKILSGKVTGQSKAEESYNELLEEMEMIKNAVVSSKKTDVPETVCYLYTEDNQLRIMSSGTYGDMLLSYTGAVNAAVNIDENLVNVSTLKIANPNYIFYADSETLAKIKSDATLRSLTAVKTNKMLMVTADEMNRQGKTAINTLQKMVYFMYPNLKPKNNAATSDQPTTTAVQQSTANPRTAATTATNPSAAAAEGTSVSAEYKINITPKLSLKPEDENNNVKVMQQRLFDLGYIDDKENITGYYGEISTQAVKQFQKKNGIKATGTADYNTLTAMFDSAAIKN